MCIFYISCSFVYKNKIVNYSSSGSWCRFGFLHRNRFLLSTVKIAIIRKIIGLIWIFFAWYLYVYKTLIILAIFDLSHRSALKKFFFTDCSVLTDSAFSFAFSILLFSVRVSLLHKFSVAVVYVSKFWACLCQGLTWELLICTNPLMRITMRFWCEGSFQVSGERMIWWDQEKWKAKAWGCSLGTSQHISRRLKHLSLGMPKASPSSSTKYQVIPSETIF